MKVVDVNILLYVVNESTSHHAPVLQWWHAAVNDDETLALPWLVIAGFIRIATNPRVFPDPLPVAVAAAHVDAWLDLESVTTIVEKPDHWPVLRRLLLEVGTAANLTTDAHLAALAMTHDATLASCDTDFMRFPGLRWESPLART